MSAGPDFSLILTAWASSLLAQLPVILVCLAGLVWAASRWSRAPGVAMCVCGGLALRLVSLTGAPLASNLLIQTLSPRASGGMQLAFVVNSFVWSSLTAVAYVLLLVAVYQGRTPHLAATRPGPPAKPS